MRLHPSAPLLWSALSLFLFYSLAWAEPDDTQQAWLDQVDVPPYWDNVEGGSEWIEGTEPKFRAGRSFHTFELSPAESSTVRVPAGERIRLYRPDSPINPGEFELSWSNGSGLFASLVSEPAGDGQSLLTPPKGSETLVRVKRKETADGQVELALFTSRDANRLVATSYRETMTPLSSGPGVRLDDGSQAVDYWQTDRENPLQLELDGATRVRIDSRLLFPDQDGPFTDSYRIFAYLNGAPWRVLNLATVLDTTAAVAVDGCNRPIGRPAYAYLDVPDGPQRLELRVRRSMLVRLLARQQPDDYLYQGNLPLNYQDTIGGAGSADSDPYFWSRTEAELRALQTKLSHPDSVTYLDAVRVAHDNAHRLGGVTAMRPLSAWARRYPGQELYQAMAARRSLLHTFYRDLMPQRGTDDGDPVFAWFLTPQLKGRPTPVFFAETYTQSLADNLASGFFTQIPAAIEDAQEFLIPEQFQSQQLRVAVDRSGLSAAQTFYIQMNDEEPVRLRVETQRLLPATEFRPTTGGIALALLQSQHRSATATLSGAFAARRSSAPLADVGFLEIPLAVPTRRLKVWRENAGTRPLRLALAYRSSGSFRMSESGYLDLLDAAGPDVVERQFQQAISAYDPKGRQLATSGYLAREAATSRQEDMHGDLYNQWLPLLRFLHSRYASFSAGIEKGGKTDSFDPPDPAKIEEIVQQAEAAERDGDWHSALEMWSWIRRTADGAVQIRARSRQIHALQKLGNQFLAKQLLRHDFLYARQSAQTQQALEQLIDLVAGEGDLESMLTLRAVAAILDPVTTNLKELAASLIATGRSHFAMQVLVAMPAEQRPANSVLETAYDLGWWRLFEQTLAGSSDTELNALWRGYRAQLKGDYQGAFDHWREAGQPGQDLSRHLAAGLDIRDGLDAPDQDLTTRSLIFWEEWQQGVPGPRVWRGIPQSVTGHSGVRSVLSIARGKMADLFQATPEKPVTVSVYGPTSLRLEVRPLHDSTDGEPINDWIGITAQGVASRYPIIDNRISEDLHLAENSGPYPGRKVEILRQVPAGYHELKLSGIQTDLLIGVSAYNPRFPLTVLPPLTPYTVRRALADGVSSPALLADSGNVESVPVQVVKQCTGQTLIALYPFAAVQEGAKLELPITPPTAAWFQELERYRSRLAGERDRLKGHLHEKVAKKKAPSLKSRLIQLLWEAEQVPGRYEAALTQAESLAREQPYEAGIESILRRLRRHASWQLVRSAQESAGVRLVEFIGWQPESPELKTRKAIMALHAGDEQVISGHDTRVLAMYNLSPVEIILDLSMQDAAYLPAQTMRVRVAWDDSPETEVLLSAQEPDATLVNTIDAGDHVLRIRIAQPLANQFLRVRVNERRGKTSLAIAEPAQRSYMLATRDQPLVLLVQGPTRLRIDEWRDDHTLITYRTLEPDWQRVIIPVEPEREEALLRVFRRALESGKPTASARDIKYVVEPVAGSLWSLEQGIQIPDLPVSEPLAGGWLAEGTWSLISGLTSRSIVDDEPQASSEEERFLTLGTAYRYFSERQDTYYHADGRVRLREQGDPTLATRGSVSIRKPHWPLDLDVAGSLFLQHLDDTGHTEAAATLRARISRRMRLGEKISHRPSLSVFQRGLSLDGPPDNDPEKVDQDIFTRYKHEHKRGLRAGDRIQYRPWLDTNLYAGAYLVSNEDLNIIDPDHLGFNVGVRQLIGDVDLGIRYSHFQYYEDGDRDKDSDAQRLRLDLGFSRWFNPRHGLQARLRYEYDQDTADSSIFLSLSLNRSNGRYYRDYTPSDLDFRHLRQRRVLEQQVSAGSE